MENSSTFKTAFQIELKLFHFDTKIFIDFVAPWDLINGQPGVNKACAYLSLLKMYFTSQN